MTLHFSKRISGVLNRNRGASGTGFSQVKKKKDGVADAFNGQPTRETTLAFESNSLDA